MFLIFLLISTDDPMMKMKKMMSSMRMFYVQCSMYIVQSKSLKPVATQADSYEYEKEMQKTKISIDGWNPKCVFHRFHRKVIFGCFKSKSVVSDELIA